MSVRRFAARICAAVFLCAAVFVLPAVSAAQALRSDPGEWVVGPINIKSSSGLSFCSMKTRYANGQSLVVASDSKGAHSLAIDFGKKTLSAGSQYYVTFYAGPVHRTMIAIAATTEVLISQMGNDPDFFMMMRSRDALEADFNDQRLRFALKGSAAALDELQNCVTAMGKGQGYTQAKVATPEQAAEKEAQKKAVAQEIAKNDDLKLGEQALSSSLSDEVRRLREENQRLRQENQIVAARLKESDLAAAEADLARLAEMEGQQRALQVENDRLRAEQATLNAVTSVLSPAPPAREEVETAKAVQPAAGVAVPVQPMPAAVTMPDRVLGWMNLSDLAPEAAEGVNIWRWQTADVMVALQPWPLAEGDDITMAAAGYIDILQSRCGGDFARKMAAPQEAAPGLILQTAEIACISIEGQAAAGLVFLSQGSDMAVVTYETDTETMREALAQRALLISAASLQR